MSLFSMTGFASAEQNTENYTLTINLRAVNHRFLDINVRVPDELRPLEYVLRERIASRMRRGKVDCQVQLTARNDIATPPAVDPQRLTAVLAAARLIRSQAPDAAPLSTADLLRWPGVVNAGDVSDPEAQTALALTVFDSAWNEFAACRQREGEKLTTVLNQCCTAMESLISDLQPRLPQILAAYKEKLIARLQEAALDPDENRIKQELALFATRIEVSEELDRLTTHIAEVRRVLKADDDQETPATKRGAPAGSRGKRLDFLAQELHRESNTLGSKSVDAQMSQTALELKVLVEQMREQVQNIE